MSDRGVNLSDFELARQLSHDLAMTRSSDDRAAPEEQWVRFDPTRLGITPSRGQAPSPGPGEETAPTTTPLPTIEPETMEDWSQLLDWALSIWPAAAGFVVDSAGFVIATAGAWEFERLEGVGSQLLDVARRAVQIEGAGRTQFLAVQFEEFWLSGLTVWRGTDELLIVATLGDAPLDASSRHAIAQQIAWNLDRL